MASGAGGGPHGERGGERHGRRGARPARDAVAARRRHAGGGGVSPRARRRSISASPGRTPPANSASISSAGAIVSARPGSASPASADQHEHPGEGQEGATRHGRRATHESGGEIYSVSRPIRNTDLTKVGRGALILEESMRSRAVIAALLLLLAAIAAVGGTHTALHALPFARGRGAAAVRALRRRGAHPRPPRAARAAAAGARPARRWALRRPDRVSLALRALAAHPPRPAPPRGLLAPFDTCPPRQPAAHGVALVHPLPARLSGHGSGPSSPVHSPVSLTLAAGPRGQIPWPHGGPAAPSRRGARHAAVTPRHEGAVSWEAHV